MLTTDMLRTSLYFPLLIDETGEIKRGNGVRLKIVHETSANVNDVISGLCVCGLHYRTREEDYFCPKCGAKLIQAIKNNRKGFNPKHQVVYAITVREETKESQPLPPIPEKPKATFLPIGQ